MALGLVRGEGAMTVAAQASPSNRRRASLVPAGAGRVWLEWLTANVLPSLIVSALVLATRTALGIDRLAVVAYAVLFGLVAVLQSVAIARSRGRSASPGAGPSRRWAGWTLLGLVLAMFFGVGTLATLDGLGNERLGMLAGWSIAGLVLGGIQAVALRAPPGTAILWVLASIVGWLAGAVVWDRLARHAAALGESILVRTLLGGLAIEGNNELAITALTFALYGAVTGLVLVRLSRAAAETAGRA